MIINRAIESKIITSLIPQKVLILLGPRRVEKTVLLKQLLQKVSESYLLLNGEDYETHHLLEKRSAQNYKNLLGQKKLLVIDEAQKIPDVGIKLKLIVDEIEVIKILVTGSSAFDIQGQLGEPLTGRKNTFYLFPFAEQELVKIETESMRRDNLLQRLIYGNYPEITFMKNLDEKAQYLKEIINSYLMRDILIFENIKNSAKVINLLRLISYQVGSEVSLNELGKQLQ